MRTPLPVLATVTILLAACGSDDTPDVGAPDDDPLVVAPGDGAPPDTVAVPADAVDCRLTLPCEVADGALSLRLTAAQGEQADGSGDFRVDLAVASARGGDVALATTSTLAAGETRLDGALVTIDGEGSGFDGAASASLAPATEAAASVEFIGSVPDETRVLDLLTLVLRDGERETSVRFANVPVGSAGEPVDCALTLPCAASSPDGAVTVTVDGVDVRAADAGDDLVVGYALAAARPVSVAAEGYTRATGDAGEAFAQSALELDGERTLFGAPLVATLAPDDTLRATLDMAAGSTTASAPRFADTAIERLELSLVELAEPRLPYWNPVFLNLPIAR